MARRIWLVAARRDRGLSQSDVARACTSHQSSVALWESGASPVPAHMVPALAQALGIDPWIIHVSMGQIPPELASHDPEVVASALRALPADDGQGMARCEAAIRDEGREESEKPTPQDRLPLDPLSRAAE